MTNTAAEENRPSGGEKEMLREFIPSSEVDENLATGDGRSDGGYHMIILERKPEEPGPTPSEVIARAVKTGLLSGEGIDIGLQQHIKAKRKKTKKSSQIFSQHKGIPMTISAQNKVTTKKLTPQNPNSRRPFH